MEFADKTPPLIAGKSPEKVFQWLKADENNCPDIFSIIAEKFLCDIIEYEDRQYFAVQLASFILEDVDTVVKYEGYLAWEPDNEEWTPCLNYLHPHASYDVLGELCLGNNWMTNPLPALLASALALINYDPDEGYRNLYECRRVGEIAKMNSCQCQKQLGYSMAAKAFGCVCDATRVTTTPTFQQNRDEDYDDDWEDDYDEDDDDYEEAPAPPPAIKINPADYYGKPFGAQEQTQTFGAKTYFGAQ